MEEEENDGCGGLLAGIWAFAGILMILVVCSVVASVVVFAVASGAAV